MVECAVCDGRFTVDRLVELRFGPPIKMNPVPLCPKHYFECEDAVWELSKTKSPPLIINVQAVGTGVDPGKFG